MSKKIKAKYSIYTSYGSKSKVLSEDVVPTSMGDSFLDRLDRSSDNISKSKINSVPNGYLPAIILKTEKISVDQIPSSHNRAGAALKLTDLQGVTESLEAVTVQKHYAIVAGQGNTLDVTKVPPELLTIVYEIGETDDVDQMTVNRKCVVEMLGHNYGVLRSNAAGGLNYSEGGGTGASDSIVGAFGKQGGEIPASAYGPSKGVQGSVTFATGIQTNSSIWLYQVFRAMLKAYAGAYWHSIWISGVYATVTAENGLKWQYMHLDPRVKVKKGDKVRKGQLIGHVARTGLMGPLHASKPHLHLQVKRGNDKIDPEPLMKSYWAKSGGPPNADWDTWINKKDEWKKTPHGWFSLFKASREGGAHGAIDIGTKEGHPIVAAVPGTVTHVSNGDLYLKSVARFKEAIQYYNQQIRKGNFVMKYRIQLKGKKDKKTGKRLPGPINNYAIPFEKDQIINLVGPGTDVSFDYRLGGKIQTHIPGRKTQTPPPQKKQQT